MAPWQEKAGRLAPHRALLYVPGRVRSPAGLQPPSEATPGSPGCWKGAQGGALPPAPTFTPPGREREDHSKGHRVGGGLELVKGRMWASGFPGSRRVCQHLRGLQACGVRESGRWRPQTSCPCRFMGSWPEQTGRPLRHVLPRMPGPHRYPIAGTGPSGWTVHVPRPLPGVPAAHMPLSTLGT